MNNSSSRTGLVLVAVVALVGMVWLGSGSDGEVGSVETVPTRAADAGPVSFTPMTPQDLVKKRNLEAVQRKIAEAREKGEELPGGLIKVTEDDGSSYLVSPKLVEGVGRNGEPLYAFVQLAKTAPGPLQRPKGSQRHRMKTPKRADVISRFDGGSEDGNDRLDQGDDDGDR